MLAGAPRRGPTTSYPATSPPGSASQRIPSLGQLTPFLLPTGGQYSKGNLAWMRLFRQ